MKKIVLFLVAFIVLGGATAQAQTAAPGTTNPAKPLTAQQARMKTCAAQYQEQKNTAKVEYHHFMSQCLRKYPLPTKPGTAAK